MAKYGIPYMGSKQSIANKILTILPKADNFYDLFGGGFSITHCAILSGKYGNFYFNEIQDDICRLIQDAIAGKYNYDVFKPEFISREEFLKRKDSDAYIKYVWSFGNSGTAYLFGKDIEGVKKSLHQAVIFGEFDKFAKGFFGFDKWDTDNLRHRRLVSRRIAGQKYRAGELQQLERLEQLQQLQQLERLQQLQRLEFTQKDYRDISIKEKSIVYLDPPYIGTEKYDNKEAFNHAIFYDWVKNLKHPAYFSEYTAPEYFKCIAGIGKHALLKATEARTRKIEKIFTNKIGYEYLMDYRNTKHHTST